MSTPEEEELIQILQGVRDDLLVRRSRGRIENNVFNKVEELAKKLRLEVTAIGKSQIINGRACVVCGRDNRPIKMRSNGPKCVEGCVGMGTNLNLIVVPEEFNHLEITRAKRNTTQSDSSDDDDDAIVPDVGCTINGYKIEAKLGKGAQGTVYRARHVLSQQEYAMKIVPRSKNKAQDINKEIAIMKTLTHPSIIRIIAIINDEKSRYLCIVMEYLSGGQIYSIGDAPIPLPRLQKYIVGIATGLVYLHKKGVYHRDIKPENILLDDGDNIKLADFGVSSMIDESDVSDRVDAGQGSPAYWPPECFTDPEVHGRAQDVWALGVTVFGMATGRLPFSSSGDVYSELRGLIQKSDPTYPADLDPSLKRLLCSMLEKSHARRCTVGDILNHDFVREVRFSKGFPVETASANLETLDSADEQVGPSADAAFFIPPEACFNQLRAATALQEFITEGGPKFQVVAGSKYSITLYPSKM